MKGDTEVILFVAFFFAGAIFGSSLSNESMAPYLTTVLSALATLGAAFFGAKYAFLLQENKRLRETVRLQVKSGNKIISSLNRIRNIFVAFRSQFIKPHENNPMRRYFIQPTTGTGGFRLDIDYDSLDFLFISSDPDYLGRLTMLEQEVISTVEVINQRSDFHYHRLQPAVERIEQIVGPNVSPELIDQELGQRDAQVLHMMTEQMIESVDRIVDLSETLGGEANKLIKELHPGHQVIKITYPNRNNMPAQTNEG